MNKKSRLGLPTFDRITYGKVMFVCRQDGRSVLALEPRHLFSAPALSRPSKHPPK